MPRFSQTTDEERTTKRTYEYYEEIENLTELDDATTEMMPRTQSKLIDVYAIFIAELDALKGKIVQREARIALLMKLRGEYREEVETYKRTVKKYEEESAKQTEQSSTMHQAELDALKASLHEQIRLLTVERDEQRARLEEFSAALGEEQAARQDLVDELAKKEETIKILREKADETTRLTAAAEGVLHSEIKTLKDTVAQQTTQISSLEVEIEHERLKRREAEKNFATSRRTLEIELERKSTAYGDVQRQAADAESSHRAELEALRTQISEADAKFKQELSTLHDRLRREQEDTADLRSQNDRLSSESLQSAQELQSKLSGAVAKYEQERKLRGEKEVTIEAMRADAERARETSRAENVKLQSQFFSTLTEIAKLQKELQAVHVDAEQNKRDASERIRALESDLTSAHDELKSAQDAHDRAMDETRTTSQALEKKLKSSEQELERLRGTLQATQSATLHSQDVYRKEAETLQSQISTLQQELKDVRSEKDKVVESMRADTEQSQTASIEESQTLRERIKVLERRLDELQNQLKTTELESVRIQEASRKMVATLKTELEEKDSKMQQLQDAEKQKVMDVEIKFQEKLKNSRTEFTQLVQIIIERDKLIVRMREEITRMTADTRAQILRIERRHREEEQTFYRRLEEKDETIANLERENLNGRDDRSRAFTRAAAKIDDELRYLREYQDEFSKTDIEMDRSESENTTYRDEVDKMQTQYSQSMQNLRTAMNSKDFMDGAFSSSSAVTAEVTLRPRPAGKGFEPELMTVGSEEKSQSQRSHIVTGPNGKPITVRTDEEKTRTRKITSTADGRFSQMFRFSKSTDVKSS